ncbi:MAG: hypothetical protein ACRDQB_07270 [Thermocrispum sp.]
MPETGREPADAPAEPPGSASDGSACSEPGAAPGRRPASARRLHDVFGEVLPETTSDEREQRSSSDEAGREEWMQANRPPHH